MARAASERPWHRPPGQVCALRGVHSGRILYAQSVIVVHDAPGEVALLLLPGAQCMHPTGWKFGAHGDGAASRRWAAIRTGDWTLSPRRWDTNRFLMLLEPEKYFATMCVWRDEPNTFKCYYINFQLPFRRSSYGFDTLDLELDIVAGRDGAWHWKDQDDFEEGIREGGILPEWVKGIKRDQVGVLERLSENRYPVDGSWLDWQPDSAWLPPGLPQGWDQI